MGRFEPNDFGYDFASKPQQEQESLVATNRPGVKNSNVVVSNNEKEAGDYGLYHEQENDDLLQYKPSKDYHGKEESYISNSYLDDSSTGTACVCTSAFCCCLTICLLIAGGILMSYSSNNNNEQDTTTHAFVGSVLLVLGAASCLFACCSFCLGLASVVFGMDLVGSSEDLNAADPNYKEVKVRFRRLNHRYAKSSTVSEGSLDRARCLDLEKMAPVKEALKKQAKLEKQEETQKRKQLESHVKRDLEAGISIKDIRQKYRPICFLIVFEGDVSVSNMELLRKQVSLVVNLGQKGDQCVVLISSPGGAVTQYGLAASQLVRIRKAGIHLVACVDTIAASGGYMMASVANTICAAPFALVGSIGVVTQIPNFQRFLNDKKIDAYLMTAGKHKRTIDLIGDVTEEGKQKLEEELEDIHIAFKDHVALARPKLKENIESITTGECWLAVQAKGLGLVDNIMTSDEYLTSLSDGFDIIEILKKEEKHNMWRDWHDTAASAKSLAKRFATAAVPETSPTPMAIV